MRGCVHALAYSPDGKYLATGDWTGSVSLREAATGKRVRDWQNGGLPLFGARLWIDSLCFSPDGRLLASGRADGTGRIWNIAKGNEKAQFQGEPNQLMSLTFSRDGRYFAAAGLCFNNGPAIHVWETAGKEVQRLGDSTTSILSALSRPMARRWPLRGEISGKSGAVNLTCGAFPRGRKPAPSRDTKPW